MLHEKFREIEDLLKTKKEANYAITDKIKIDKELMKMLKDLLENPKK